MGPLSQSPMGIPKPAFGLSINDFGTLLYKISLKIPGMLTKKKIYNKNYINEKNKLI